MLNSPSKRARRCSSPIRTRHGNDPPTRTPTACCASISPRAPTCHGGPLETSKPSPSRSTTDPARASTGALPQKYSKTRYAHSNNPVLQRPLEPSQYVSLALTAELAQAGIAGSIGTVGDALDNALCESTIGLFKTEAIHDGGPTWKNRAEVEWQVTAWVRWYNHNRLHSAVGHLPPLEFENAHRQAKTVAPIPEVA